jgi:hypothetical protein
MIFSRNKRLAVSNFVVKLVNNNCPDLMNMLDGPRGDTRVNLTVVVLAIPLEKKKLQVTRAFHAITKDFSSTSVSVIVDSPRTVEDAILGFRWDGDMYFVRANSKHLSPLGGGFHQLGFQMEEMVSPKEYPELAKLSF